MDIRLYVICFVRSHAGIREYTTSSKTSTGEKEVKCEEDKVSPLTQNFIFAFNSYSSYMAKSMTSLLRKDS